MPRIVGTLLAIVLLTACVKQDAPASVGPRPVVVQGAMDVEIRKLASTIANAREEKIQAWTFWTGTIDGYPVVISKTLKGMPNAAVATSLAAERFHPVAIINQGTAGGHIPGLRVFDIVIGTQSVNLGSFKTGYRERGRVTEGVIGSSEVWNSEIDRIERFHETFGTTVEEMETAAAAQIAAAFQIPFLGVRVVSNNITNGGTYDTKTGEACQEFVYNVVRNYVGGTLKR
jgi:adenosylhomocysteine nucleosidase